PPPLPDSVPPRLARVVSMMMAKSRDQRYPDARSARKALQAVQAMLAELAGVPIRMASEDTGVVDPADIFPPGYDRNAPIGAEQSGPMSATGSQSGPHAAHVSASGPYAAHASGSGPHAPHLASQSGPNPTMMGVPSKSLTLADTLTQ